LTNQNNVIVTFTHDDYKMDLAEVILFLEDHEDYLRDWLAARHGIDFSDAEVTFTD
jgi:hypothetical protein